MVALGERYATGLRGVLAEARPGLVGRGARCARGVRVRRDAAARRRRGGRRPDDDLDRYVHLALLNRGVLLTPFHAMALMSPATTTEDVDAALAVFAAVLAPLGSALSAR